MFCKMRFQLTTSQTPPCIEKAFWAQNSFSTHKLLEPNTPLVLSYEEEADGWLNWVRWTEIQEEGKEQTKRLRPGKNK